MEDRERTILRAYLLGELPEAERSELAERYFVDEHLFDELLDVEDELFDEYVSGQLSSDERKAFRDYLISLPEGASKLATAFVLSEAAREQQNVASVSSGAIVPSLPSKWANLREWFFGGGRVLRYASVAIGILLITSLAYLAIRDRQFQRDLEQQRTERIRAEREKTPLAPDTQPTQQEPAAERDRLQRLELQLAQERERQTKETSTRGEQGSPVLASLILTPSLRSTGTPDVLSLALTVKTVSLIIPVVNGEQITSYRAVLQTREGQRVLTKEGLHPKSSRRGSNVNLRLPAGLLTGDSFKLTLQGHAADGIEIAQDYYFNVVKK